MTQNALNEDRIRLTERLECEAAALDAEATFLTEKAKCLRWKADIKRRESEFLNGISSINQEPAS